MNWSKFKIKTKKKLTVTCPRCKNEISYYDSPFRPFCSQRCRLIDLGQWMDESFRIEVKGVEVETDYLDGNGEGDEEN